MKLRFFLSVLIASASVFAGEVNTKPRIFIAGSEPESVSGEALVGDTRSSLALTRSAPSYDIESMRAFSNQCPGVVVTTNREKADLIVRVERDDPNPTTPFVKANKIALFNLNDELIYATRARLLSNATKDACKAILAHGKRK